MSYRLQTRMRAFARDASSERAANRRRGRARAARSRLPLARPGAGLGAAICRFRRVILGGALAGLLASVLATFAPATAPAAVITYGSPLAVSATLNTAENLSYQGTYTPLPGYVFHTFHYGADTALWDVSQGGASLSVPATGQALKISLEGCAQPAAGGPAPLTQIHFQDLSPLPGGGARVNLTSQAFEIPVCGVHEASGSTVTAYEPSGLCVSQGDYLGFNDDGGYVENVYRAGVPYQVLGAVDGSTMDSFIKGNGTGNGAIMSPSEVSANEGFATNQNEELLMQARIGTGADAAYVCGGRKGAPPVLPVIHVRPQTDGVNRSRVVKIAIYCRPAGGCPGTAMLTNAGIGESASDVVGRATFDLRGDTTSLVSIRISRHLLRLIRKHHGAATTVVASVDGHTFTQTIEIKIF
jgi:hypothetical protein